ncbi:MAG: DsbA family protein [Candidatus Gracilibacteria bacterium]|jgi:protein-disulfide isomerase
MSLSNSEKNYTLPIAIIIAAVLLSGSMVFLGFKLGGTGSIKDQVKKGLDEYIQEQQAKAQADAVAANQPKTITGDFTDDDPVEGSKDAKVTIVEFSDFQCPYCGKFFSEAYQDIKKDYIDTGKVKLVFRDLPLTDKHPGAMPAALAANCAREQGGDSAYFKMHDELFTNQSTIFADTTKIDATLKQIAAKLKLDAEGFASCYDSKKYANEVAKDISDASSVGISGTPAFIVGDQYISGARPYATFKAAIDAALAK